MKIVWSITNIKMQYNSFEERINRKLANATMPPSAEIWDNIRKDLDEPPLPPNRRWGWIGLLLCLCGIALFIFMQKSTSANDFQTKTLATKRMENSHLPSNIGEKKQEKIANFKREQVSILAKKAKHEPAITTKNLSNAQVFEQNQAKNINPDQTILTKEILAENPVNSQIQAVSIVQKDKNITENSEIQVIENKRVGETESSVFSPKKEKTSDIIATKNIVSSFPYQHNEVSPNLQEIKPIKKLNNWRWNVSTGSYSILYQSLNSYQENANRASLQQKIGIANIVVGDSTTNFAIFNDQSLATAAQISTKNNDTALLKVTVSPNTQFLAFSGEYRISRHIGIETGLNMYHQKVSRVLVPVENISSYWEAIASSKTTPYLGNEKTAIPFQFYIAEPRILANFHFSQKRNDIALATGFAYRAALNNNNDDAALRIAYIASDDATIYNRHNFSMLARAKYTYFIQPNMGIFAAANAQMLLSRMYSKGISQKAPAMLGLELGISF